MKSDLRMRIRLLAILVVLTPLGFASKFYAGPFAWWVNDFLGGSLYVLFWCFFAAFLLPKAGPVGIVLWVLIITCCLEVLQLWHPPVLEQVRSHFVGRTLIGTTFVLMDFPYYILGSLCGWTILAFLQKKIQSRETE